MRQVVDVAAEGAGWLSAFAAWKKRQKRKPWIGICRVCTLRLQSGLRRGSASRGLEGVPMAGCSLISCMVGSLL